MTPIDRDVDERVVDRFPVEDGAELWAVDEGPSGAGGGSGLPVLEGWAVTYSDRPNFSGRIIVPGAFRESLRQRPLKRYPLVMGYEHSTFGGTNPIGAWHGVEDDPEQGIHLSDGRISATSLGKDVGELVRDKALNGLSIGFMASDATFAEQGEEVEFKLPYGHGKRRYTVEDEGGVTFVTKGILLETSVVGAPADNEARLTRIQAITSQAARALPGLAEEASWDDVRYSMALLMGGRGAGHDLRDLPVLERVAMYQRLSAGYARQGKTPPPFTTDPDFKTVEFSEDERNIFSGRYLEKRLSDAVAGARGLSGPISRDGCAMALQLNRELVKSAGQLPAESRQHVRELISELLPLIADTKQSDLAAFTEGLAEVLATLRS